MKTTLDIDDRLLERAKRHASAQGTTLRAVVEEALRERLAPRPKATSRYPFSPPPVRASRPEATLARASASSAGASKRPGGPAGRASSIASRRCLVAVPPGAEKPPRPPPVATAR
jgi:hypothetical protein